MNTAIKTVSNGPHVASFSFRAALFHSTPVSDRKRRTHWDSGVGSSRDSSKRHNGYAKRVRRMDAKRTLLRNVGAYADNLFQSWKAVDDEDDQSSRRSTSWFKRQYWANGTKKSSSFNWESQWESYRSRRKGGFAFCCSDDEEVETIFRSAFGGERIFCWSYNSAENFQWRNSSGSSNYRSSWGWRFKTDDDGNDNSTDCDSSESDLASDRQALGLSASGPLKLEEVKSAYRACALRWHPDRHQGPSKEAAEEKFKHCSSAYKSLCEKFAID